MRRYGQRTYFNALTPYPVACAAGHAGGLRSLGSANRNPYTDSNGNRHRDQYRDGHAYCDRYTTADRHADSDRIPNGHAYA